MRLARALEWRWPGCHAITSDDVLTRWDGPLPRPTDAEIAQALTDYTAAEPTLLAEAQAAEHINKRATAALTWVILRRLFQNDTVAQTKAKHAALRDEVIAAYMSRPWG